MKNKVKFYKSITNGKKDKKNKSEISYKQEKKLMLKFISIFIWLFLLIFL